MREQCSQEFRQCHDDHVCKLCIQPRRIRLRYGDCMNIEWLCWFPEQSRLFLGISSTCFTTMYWHFWALVANCTDHRSGWTGAEKHEADPGWPRSQPHAVAAGPLVPQRQQRCIRLNLCSYGGTLRLLNCTARSDGLTFLPRATCIFSAHLALPRGEFYAHARVLEQDEIRLLFACASNVFCISLVVAVTSNHICKASRANIFARLQEQIYLQGLKSKYICKASRDIEAPVVEGPRPLCSIPDWGKRLATGMFEPSARAVRAR